MHRFEQNFIGILSNRCGPVVRIKHSKCFGLGSNPGTDDFFERIFLFE
jgi:hypothetical protein